MASDRMAVVIEKLRAASESASKGIAYTAGRPWFTNIDGVLIGSPDPHAGTLIAELDTTHLDPDEAYEIDDAANADFLAEAWNFARMILGSPALVAALRDAGTGRDSGEAMREAAAKVVEAHTYKGQGTEDRNDLIGMFARGQMRCKVAVAKKIRALPLQTGSDGHE